jgi:putative Mn2+ efflux pump MntP
MDMPTILLIAVALAMDAFAVSIAGGLNIRQFKVNHALRIAFFFGLFQGIMPVIGWLAGFNLRQFISAVDHWIAFGLLLIIGVKMIVESIRKRPDKKKIDPLNVYVLLILAVATSIDALAVGLSLAFLKLLIITPAIIIAIVTFILSFIGVILGNRTGDFLQSKVEFLGGLILIIIGSKILIEHLDLVAL